MKRFFAKDMRTALAEVKETLGSDAVIMSNKKVTGGIEIVAAVDESSTKTAENQAGRELADDSVKLSSNSSKKHHKTQGASGARQETDDFNELKESLTGFMQQHQQRHQVHRQRQQPRQQQPQVQPLFDKGAAPQPLTQQAGWGKKSEPLFNTRPAEDKTAQGLAALKDEMNAMRKLLEHQVSGLMHQELERQEPVRAMLIKRLESLGFEMEMADLIAGYIPEESSSAEAWRTIADLLTAQVSVGNDEILSQGGAVALLGPTGVGKTTTIAKLAAQFAMRYGVDSVALITTDNYRIGAHEQLSTYGKIMGCAVRVANDEEELAQLLYQFKDRRLVLIDTAGMSQRDVRLHEQLDRLMATSRVTIRNYLVMSANAQRRVVEETVKRFQRIPLAGTILTKLDESLVLGEVLNECLRHALPISYVTNGQQVPEDISVANARALVTQALKGSEPKEHEAHWYNETAQDKVSDVYK